VVSPLTAAGEGGWIGASVAGAIVHVNSEHPAARADSAVNAGHSLARRPRPALTAQIAVNAGHSLARPPRPALRAHIAVNAGHLAREGAPTGVDGVISPSTRRCAAIGLSDALGRVAPAPVGLRLARGCAGSCTHAMHQAAHLPSRRAHPDH
jgi:hypothetical protein